MTAASQACLTIDTDALLANMHAVRHRIGGGRRFMAVIKGDGYGVGAVVAARAAQVAGADALATGSPETVGTLREAGITLPILLYPCAPPAGLRSLVAPGTALTAHDLPSLYALADSGLTAEIWLKLECGNGRLGLTTDDLAKALHHLRRAPQLRLAGVYSQFAAPDRPDEVQRQHDRFERMLVEIRAAGFDRFEVMVSSSILVADEPALDHTMVNPGRMLFGILDADRRKRLRLRPVHANLSAPLIQARPIAASERPYGHATPNPAIRRAGVVALGFMHGFAGIAGAPARFGGVSCPVIGPSSMDHTVIDLTQAPEAGPGDVVTFLGGEIAPEAFAEGQADQPVRTLPRLGRLAYRRYVGALTPLDTH